MSQVAELERPLHGAVLACQATKSADKTTRGLKRHQPFAECEVLPRCFGLQRFAGGSLSKRCNHASQLWSGQQRHVEQVGRDALLHCRVHGLGLRALVEAAKPHALVAGTLATQQNIDVRLKNPEGTTSMKPFALCRSEPQVNQCAASLFWPQTIFSTIFKNYET